MIGKTLGGAYAHRVRARECTCGLRNGNASAEKVEMMGGEVFWSRAWVYFVFFLVLN